MKIDTKYRSDADEIMDDFAMEGEVLRDALDKIASINQLLGGNKVTLQGVENLLSKIDKSKQITIVDIGCGNGDMLRMLADYANRKNWNFKLTGIDANAFTIRHAQQLSSGYSNISYQCDDIFENDFRDMKYDICLCTLTLHHFKDDEIKQLMNVFHTNASIGIVVNDLHRSKMAYHSFQLLCFIFRLNYMSKQDGLTSILRGFKKQELADFSKELQLTNYTIRWKWAFRYQWIISKI